MDGVAIGRNVVFHTMRHVFRREGRSRERGVAVEQLVKGVVLLIDEVNVCDAIGLGITFVTHGNLGVVIKIDETPVSVVRREVEAV